ncbi:MAG: IS256 family transposase [Candidatus Omnitrophica bacterium]|nr:IS256 family transposase [Candidatus Omnitrophota bacterium]MDE2232484.1 IS256 family transposase [Candidatus Omnitrophota bacterium]
MPKKRIPPSQQIDNEINELRYNLGEAVVPKNVLGKLMNMAMRRIVQEILENEVSDFTGRDYYKHAAPKQGYRNGYEPSTLRTAEGRLDILRPQVRDSAVPFESKTWPHLKKNTDQLEHMAVEMYVRGCSTRDVEALLKDDQGRILLSKSSVSRLNEVLWTDYQAFCRQDLSHLDIVYIFVDAVYEPLRMFKSRAEAIIVVWGITSDGHKVLLSIRHGNKESYENCKEIFEDLKKRGMNDPVLGTMDGAPGMIKAFEEVFPNTLRQRCLFHKKGNIISKVPSEAIDGLKIDLNGVYYARNQEIARSRAREFCNTYGAKFPSAVACFEDDLEACIAHLRCPAKHRKTITTTNLVERSFGEENRRSKVIPRFFTEKSGLKLVYSVLIRVAQGWNMVRITFNEKAQILTLRDELKQKAIKERVVKITKKSYALK